MQMSLPVVKSAKAGERGMRREAVSPEKHFLRESLTEDEEANKEEQRSSKTCMSDEIEGLQGHSRLR